MARTLKSEAREDEVYVQKPRDSSLISTRRLEQTTFHASYADDARAMSELSRHRGFTGPGLPLTLVHVHHPEQ